MNLKKSLFIDELQVFMADRKNISVYCTAHIPNGRPIILYNIWDSSCFCVMFIVNTSNICSSGRNELSSENLKPT